MLEVSLLLVLLLTLAAISHAQPHLTRPDLFFAYTVSREFPASSIAGKILRLYRLIGWTGTAVSVVLLLTQSAPVPVTILGTLLSWSVAYFAARHQTRPYRAVPQSVQNHWVRFAPGKIPGGLGAVVGPFLILAAKAAYVYLYWSDIPQKLPVHWGLNGPDRWVERSALFVYGSLAWVAVLCAVMIFLAYGILTSRQIVFSDPDAHAERRFRRLGSLGAIVLGYAFAVLLPPVAGIPPAVPYSPVILLLIVTGVLTFLLRFGQGGTRLAGPQTLFSDGSPVGDRTADECWKWGTVYYNREDPAFLVEKRFGLGWTVNFGNPWSWSIVPLLLVSLVLRFF